MLIMASCICLISCSEEEDSEKFDYPLETLYGKWDCTHVYANGKWLNLSLWIYEDLRCSITFIHMASCIEVVISAMAMGHIRLKAIQL